MTIRDADVHAEQEAILDVLRDGDLPHATPEHYEWLYLRNPDGPARAWVVTDDRSGKIIGAAAAFPRRLHVQGRTVLGWNLGDFCIRKDHRALGPALALQRACVAPVLSGEVGIAYDHPSDVMVAIYRRMKLGTDTPVTRFARLLRVDEKVRSVLPDGWIARTVSGVANAALRVAARGRRRESPGPAEVLGGRFDERADTLDTAIAGDVAISGVRDSRYLNWRYLDHPSLPFEATVIERDGRLLGYAVFRVHGTTAVVADLNSGGDRTVDDALIGHVEESLRRRRVGTLSVPAIPGTARAEWLQACGFSARESTPMVVVTAPGGELERVANDSKNWFYSDGDRDV